MAKFNMLKKWLFPDSNNHADDENSVSNPDTINHMGEDSFTLSDKESLVSRVMTTFLSSEGSYYEKGDSEMTEIISLMDKVDPEFIAKLAIYARNEGNLRSVSHLLAGRLAKYLSGEEWAKRFYDRIVVRPDDMSEILACYAYLNGMDSGNISKIPNAIKRGFKSALERFDAYQIDKYRMERRDISLVDLVNLFHPRGDEKNAEAYRRLMKGECLAGLYETKILEKEMSSAGQTAATEEEKRKAKHDAIASVVDNVSGMPVMNLIRNLRNIILYAPDKVDEVCGQLHNVRKIENSRLLPFRFASAYGEVEKMDYPYCVKSEIPLESDLVGVEISENEFKMLKSNVLKALEDALQISCERNIPKLEGSVAVLVDHSGSVRGDGGGSSRVSPFSSVTTAMIGNLFGCMMAYRQDNVYLGLFGDRLIHVPINRRLPILDMNMTSYEMGAKCGGATETGIYDFFRAVVKERKELDNIIVFSDCQIGDIYTKREGSWAEFTPWYGTDSKDRGDNFQNLFKKFRKINPKANVIVVDIKSYGNTVFPFDPVNGVQNLAGWSDRIFSQIEGFTKGYSAVIKSIEAIKL